VNIGADAVTWLPITNLPRKILDLVDSAMRRR